MFEETETAEVETQADAVIGTEAEDPKESEATESEAAAVQEKKEFPFMYVGPTIPGFAIQNAVYSDIPAEAEESFRRIPELRNLFIEISDYPAAADMIRTRAGYIYRAFQKAYELRK